MTSHLGHRAGSAATTELRTAAALRWQRPLLTAELAGQACARAAADGDDDRWLRAAGWVLDGYAASGDARDVAVAILDGLTGRAPAGAVAAPLRPPGAGALTRPSAVRLRAGLAAVAQAEGDLTAARTLLDGLPDTGPGETDRALLLDRLAVEVRCSLAGPDSDPSAELTAAVERCGTELGGTAAAFADLVQGSVHRALRDRDAAVTCALRGLARLDWTPDRPQSRPLSSHLAAALLSQWITALLDGGPVPAEALRAAAVHEGAADAGRQGVLLRLTLARAGTGPADRAARALEAAAVDAEAAGVPALVASCRTALSELYEATDRYREALEAVRASVEADRADRERGLRFRAALAAVPIAGGEPGGGPAPRARRSPDPAPRAAPTTDVGDRSAATAQDPPVPESRGRGDTGRPAAPADHTDPDVGTRTGEVSTARTATNGHHRNGHRRNGHRATDVRRHGAVPTGPDRPDDADRRRTPEGGPTGAAAEHPPPVDDLRIDPADPLGLRTDPGSRDDHDDHDTRSAGSADDALPDDRPGLHLLEWAERSWYGPGALSGVDDPDSGAPLADALVAELRGRPAGPAPGSAAIRSGAERPRRDAATEDPGGADAVPGPGSADAVPDTGEGIVGPGESAVTRSPWGGVGPVASALVGSGADTESGRGATSVQAGRVREADSTGGGSGGPGSPEAAERAILVDVVDRDVPGAAVVSSAGALHEVAVRARRLVPPSGQARVDGDTVCITLPDADRFTCLLWARSLSAHLAGRVRRGGLPDGASLRLRVVGPTGPEGDEVVRQLTGPLDPPTVASTVAAPWAGTTSTTRAPAGTDTASGTRRDAAVGPGARSDTHTDTPSDGPAVTPAGTGTGAPAGVPMGAVGPATADDDPRPEPVAGPAMATPLDLPVPGPTAPEPTLPEPTPGGRRHAGVTVSATGIEVRPGSGGRRRADRVRSPAVATSAGTAPAVSDAAASDSAGPDPAARGSAMPDSAGLDSAGPDSGGLDSGGLDSAALDSAGLDSAALDSGGLDSAGLDSAALDPAALDSAGLDSAAPDSAAPNPVAPESPAPVPTAPRPESVDPTTDDDGGRGSGAHPRHPAPTGDGAHPTGAGTPQTTATEIPADMGLAELLAGAMAAYREI